MVMFFVLPNMTNIFQTGWNHQLVLCGCDENLEATTKQSDACLDHKDDDAATRIIITTNNNKRHGGHNINTFEGRMHHRKPATATLAYFNMTKIMNCIWLCNPNDMYIYIYLHRFRSHSWHVWYQVCFLSCLGTSLRSIRCLIVYKPGSIKSLYWGQTHPTFFLGIFVVGMPSPTTGETMEV